MILKHFLLLSSLVALTTQMMSATHDYSGSMIVSKNSYQMMKQFEFEITPAMEEGVVTVVGVSRDKISPKAQYINAVFDYGTYGDSKIGIVLGGLTNSTRKFEVKASDFSSLKSNGISNFNRKFTFGVVRSDKTVRFVVKTGNSYETIFCTWTLATETKDQELLDWLSAFPLTYNVHIGTWFDESSLKSADKKQSFYSTTLKSFIVSKLDSNYNPVVETTESFSMTNFEAQSMTVLPQWGSQGEISSCIQASAVEYLPSSSSEQLNLRVVRNILPLSSSSWNMYPANSALKVDIDSKANIKLTVPLDRIKQDLAAQITAGLEVVHTNSYYTVQVCGSFSLPEPQLGEWPLNIFLRQRQYPYENISTQVRGWINKEQSCSDPVTIFVESESQKVYGWRDYADLVICFGPVLNNENIEFINVQGATATITSLIVSQSFTDPNKVLVDDSDDEVQTSSSLPSNFEKIVKFTMAMFFLLLIYNVIVTLCMIRNGGTLCKKKESHHGRQAAYSDQNSQVNQF